MIERYLMGKMNSVFGTDIVNQSEDEIDVVVKNALIIGDDFWVFMWMLTKYVFFGTLLIIVLLVKKLLRK